MAIYGTDSPENFPSWGDYVNLDKLHLSEIKLIQVKGIMYILSTDNAYIDETNLLIPTLIGVFSVYMDASQVIGCIKSIIKAHYSAAASKHEWAYVPMTKKDRLVFERIFKMIIKEYEPAIYNHIYRIIYHGTNEEPVWTQLMFTLMVTIYKKKIVMRIVDAFLIEGFKIIYRVALAHLARRKTAILQAKSIEDLQSAIFSVEHGHAKDIADDLFRKAFKYNLGRRKISSMRKKASQSAIDEADLIDREHYLQRPLPRLLTPSAFMEQSHWISLWQWMPSRLRVMDLDCVFTTESHGFSLQTLFRKCAKFENLLMLIETDTGSIVGAFMTQSVSNRGNHFFGTGETFIFSLSPVAEKYSWAMNHRDSSFIYANDDLIGFGSGSGSFGLLIDRSLLKLKSSPTETFKNPTLFPNGKASIVTIEIYSFE